MVDESEHSLQTGFFLIIRSEKRLKTFLDGCNKGELREWIEEKLQQLDFLGKV